MTAWCLVMVAIAQALAWLSAPPTSLAAAAEREAIRRQIAGPSVGSYNNDNLSVDRETAVESVAAVSFADQQSAEPVQARDESWWRQRVATMRSKITRDEEHVAALELEIPRLDGQAVSRDDPAQQASLRKQASDARSELETLRTSLASTRRDLAALLEEARRLDVPPGWVR